jgi:hypothetical protein
VRSHGPDAGATPSVAFVTKSYAPDRERCELLCRSIRLLAPQLHHWIIVDRRDLTVFRPLDGPRTSIVTTEDLLPRRVRRLAIFGIGAGKNLWVGARVPPMRGWLVQQLAKLAVGSVAREELLIHADSDVVLVRPFADRLLHDVADPRRPFRVDGAIGDRMPNHVRWHRTAERLLGIGARPLPLPDYIGGLVPWHRDVLADLLEHLGRRAGRGWMQELARARHLSEYILYGRFVDDVLGRADSGGQRPAAPSLCRCYWGTAPLTDAEVEGLLEEVTDAEIGVMLSAKAGMQTDEYAALLERRWAAHGLPSRDARDAS